MPPALFVPSTPAPTHPGRFRSVLPLGDARVGGAFQPDLFGGLGRQAIEMAFGADLHADPGTWTWYDVTRYVLWTGRVTITPGRLDEGSLTSPAGCGFVLRDDNGDFNSNNPYGVYYPNIGVGVPTRARLDVGTGWSLRFQGETNDMTPGWEAGDAFAYVTVSAKGTMHRLDQDNVPLKTPLYRAVSRYNPVAFWQLNDGSAAGSAVNAVAGGVALSPHGDVNLGAVSDLAGSDAVVELGEDAAMTGIMAATGTTPFLGIDLWVKLFSQSGTTSSTEVMNIQSMAGLTGWQLLAFDTGWGPGIQGWLFDIPGGTSVGSQVDLPDLTPFDGLWHNIFISMTQVGADVSASMYVDGALGHTTTWSSTTLTFPSGRITLESRANGSASGVGTVTFGGLAFQSDSDAVSSYGAGVGYVGETASDRLARLCDEEGVHIEIHGSSQQTMGAQSTGTFLNLLRECEAVDNGLLYDGLGPGLSYTCINELYNAGAALVLDANAGHLLDRFAPVGDDQRVRNRWQATRPNGSAATFEQATGRLGTGRISPYDSSVSPNVESDSDLAGQAGWRGRLGTVESPRYPNMRFSLTKTPSLAARWLTTRLFQRVDVDNVDDVFTHMPAILVRQVLQGYAEWWNSKQWEVTTNNSPWEPYQVAVYDSSRYASDGSFLALAVDTTTTTWIVTTPSGPLWAPTDTGGTGAVSAPWVGTSVSGSAGGTSTTVDISGATTGEWVFVAIGIADSQTSAPTATAGWTITGQVQEGASGSASSCLTVFQRKKVAGDTTFLFTWPTNRKYEAVVISWPGLDPTTPVESVATLAHSAASASYVTSTVTPTSTDRWIAQFSFARGTTALETFTADAAMTERVDANHGGTTPFAAIQVADTNANVTAAGHTYTATCSQADPNGSVIAFALIPESSSPTPFTPYDLWCDGEVVTVTDITSATNPQTFTVTRSVNGIVKGHKDYREVTLYPQPRYAL
jgi:hypothetical protein